MFLARRIVTRGRSLHTSAHRSFIYRSLEDIRSEGSVKEAATGTWESRRYLKRSDGMGFSFHYTIIKAGSSTEIWYKNHVEAVLVVKGSGEVELVEGGQMEGEGKTFPLKPGTFYALDKQDRHFLRASRDEDMVSYGG